MPHLKTYPFYELLRFPLRHQARGMPCPWAGFSFILLFWNVVFVDVLWWLCPVQNGPPCALNGVMAMKQLTRCTCWNRYPLRGVFVSSTLQTSCSCEHKLLERSVWVRWIEQSTVMYCTMVYCIMLYCDVVRVLANVWSNTASVLTQDWQACQC